MKLTKKIDIRLTEYEYNNLMEYLKERGLKRSDACRYLLSRYEEHL